MEYLIVFVIGAVIGAAAGGLVVRQVLFERAGALTRELELLQADSDRLKEEHQEHIQTLKQDAVEKQRTIREADEKILRERNDQWRQRFDEMQKSKQHELDVMRAADERLLKEAAEAAQREKVSLIRQLQDLKEDEERLKNAFKVLSEESLTKNKAQFLVEAQQKVAPLVETQQKLQAEIRALELKRESAYTELSSQATALARETHSLNQLLANPQLRGHWGEFQLSRVVELAGLQEHVDFVTQEAGDGIRPDLIVRLPGHREVVIDSKVVLSAFRSALEAPTEQERTQYIQQHVQAVKSRIQELSKKEYQSQFETLDFIVMFIPVDAAYYAALQADKDLFEFEAQKRVFIAGPVTLLAILRAIAYSWRQVRMVENATRIGELADEFHKRLKTFTKLLSDAGGRLESAVEAYNKAVGSFQGRLLPQIRSLEGYIAIEGQNLVEAPEQVEEQIRLLAASDDQVEGTDIDGADS